MSEASRLRLGGVLSQHAVAGAAAAATVVPSSLREDGAAAGHGALDVVGLLEGPARGGAGHAVALRAGGGGGERTRLARAPVELPRRAKRRPAAPAAPALRALPSRTSQRQEWPSKMTGAKMMRSPGRRLPGT